MEAERETLEPALCSYVLLLKQDTHVVLSVVVCFSYGTCSDFLFDCLFDVSLRVLLFMMSFKCFACFFRERELRSEAKTSFLGDRNWHTQRRRGLLRFTHKELLSIQGQRSIRGKGKKGGGGAGPLRKWRSFEKISTGWATDSEKTKLHLTKTV